MDLAKKYKQLFEGKVRSNDSSLLMERNYGKVTKWNPTLQKMYDGFIGVAQQMGNNFTEVGTLMSLDISDTAAGGLTPDNAYDYAIKWLDAGKELSPEELARLRTDNDAYGQMYDGYVKAIQENDPKMPESHVALFMTALIYGQTKVKEFKIMRDILITATQNDEKSDSTPAAGGVFDHVEPVREEEELDIDDLTDPKSLLKLGKTI